jgi:hypothetical protein
MKVDLKPFAPRTTETIERANRMLAFRDSPAYHEIWRISKMLVDQATDNLIKFAGWDSDQIRCLQARAKAAAEHHELLFATIQEAIVTGVAEASSSLESTEGADKLRDQVLRKMDSENRIPGSY